LRRKNKERLGRNGIYELKEHAWLKNIPWTELYRKELVSPYIPKVRKIRILFYFKVKLNIINKQIV
jgi:hypothetical protein